MTTLGRFARGTTAVPQPLMGDINVTPLVDVMLVLLVIFLITAPIMASALHLALPRSDAAKPLESSPRMLDVSVDNTGRLFLGGERIDLPALRLRALAAAKADAQTPVHLRGDASAAYGRVIEVIGALQQAGLTRIAFVAQEEPRAASANGG